MMMLGDGADKAEELATVKREHEEAKRQRVEKESRLTAELEVVKRQKAELEVDKESLNALVASFQKIETEQSVALSSLKKDHAEALKAAEKAKLEVMEDLESVRGELSRCQDEALKSLEEGYQLCWDRAAGVGYDMQDHTFSKYCEEIAVAEDANGSSNQAGNQADEP